MYTLYLLTGTSLLTERAAVWLVLVMIIGIIQQFTEISKVSIKWKINNFVRNIKKLIMPMFYARNWWVFYFDAFNRFYKKDIMYKFRNGLVFHATSQNADGLIINEIWGNKVYTPQGFEIEKNDIIVDIGAHKGYFSIFASLKAKKGRVISFEPADKNYTTFMRNIHDNNILNISSYKMGIGKNSDTKNLYMLEGKAGGISEIKGWFKGQKDLKTIEMRTIPLDNIFDMCGINEINLLKIDCEGAEYEILFNASKLTFQKIKKITMEYHEMNNLTAKDLLQLFKKHGFVCSVSDQNRSIGMIYAYKK